MLSRRSLPLHRQCGLSMVELMVGVTVGMVVITGAISLYGTNLNTSRRVQAEMRLNQDLRAAADLMARDLRRAGYWGNAVQGTVAAAGSANTTANPYREMSFAGGTLAYNFSRDATENNALDDAERFGFKLDSGVVQMMTANGTWQGITDPNGVTVLGLTITPTTTTIDLGYLCPKTCDATLASCPSVQVRRYDLRLQGRSVRFPDMVRELPMAVRVRNERLEGQCPA